SFPETIGPDLTYNGGFTDAFVAKVHATGTALAYCGFIGDGGSDEGLGIAVDAGGNAYLTGSSQTAPGFTDTNAFVVKVNAAGTAAIYSFSLGGSSYDAGHAIAVDRLGCAYVTGETSSDESSFPETVGPDLTANGDSDAFVAKLNAVGSALVYCGYLGGAGADYGRGIVVDGAGFAYIAGETYSGEASFPVREGPDLTYNGSGDAFVAKLNVWGQHFLYCGYVGGSGEDFCRGIAIDGGGNTYIVGSAEGGSGGDFPVRTGPDTTYNGGLYDAFVAKVTGGDWLRLTAPNGGEKWIVGSQHEITWLTADLLGRVKLVYSTNRGLTWKEIVFATPDDGSYLWTVPNDPSKTVWVRVAEREGPGYDRSNAVFTILPRSTIRVASPNGGETLKGGKIYRIRWRTTGPVGNVKISYSINKGWNWTNVVSSTPSDGLYFWRVPRRASTKCLVRIWEVGDRKTRDVSDKVFTIKVD
ncbi:MAG: SBBP repeat-containing protein, partial [Candidatus Aminicenantes bacterium]|nr:SBBP repeat-containing protein [Candidatus Aminicenantes bacterium]